MALGALGGLLVEGNAFAGGEWFPPEAVDLGNVGRSRRGRIMQEFAQHPGAAFDGAGLLAVAAHGEDGGHTQKPAPGRALGEFDLAELVPYDPRDLVVLGQQAVDEDRVGFEELAEAGAFFEEGLERLKDFLLGGGLGGQIEVAVELRVELEEIEPGKPQPLRDKRLGEAFAAFVGQQSLGLSGENARFAEFTAFGQRDEFLVGRAAPQEKSEPGGQFQFGELPGSALGGGFSQVKETGGGQEQGEGLLEGVQRFGAFVGLGVVNRDEFIEELRGNLAAPQRFGGECVEEPSGVGFFFLEPFELAAHIAECFGRLRRLKRPLHLHPVDPYGVFGADSCFQEALAKDVTSGPFSVAVTTDGLFRELKPTPAFGVDRAGEFQDLGFLHGACHLVGAENLGGRIVGEEIHKTAFHGAVRWRRHAGPDLVFARGPVARNGQAHPAVVEVCHAQIRAGLRLGQGKIIGRLRHVALPASIHHVGVDGVGKPEFPRRGRPADFVPFKIELLFVVLVFPCDFFPDFGVFGQARGGIHLAGPPGVPLPNADKFRNLAFHGGKGFRLGLKTRFLHRDLGASRLETQVECFFAQLSADLELVGRHKQGGAHRVERVGAAIGRECADVERDSEQLLDGVLVFAPVEAPHRDLSPLIGERLAGRHHGLGECLQKIGFVALLRLFCVFGRHFARVDGAQNLGPALGFLQ